MLHMYHVMLTCTCLYVISLCLMHFEQRCPYGYSERRSSLDNNPGQMSTLSFPTALEAPCLVDNSRDFLSQF